MLTGGVGQRLRIHLMSDQVPSQSGMVMPKKIRQKTVSEDQPGQRLA